MTDSQHSIPLILPAIIYRLTVLPYQNPHLIADVIKDIRLKEPSSPYPNHILVPLHLTSQSRSSHHKNTHEHLNPFPELGFGTSSLDRIDWNPITSPDKDSLVVDLEVEGGTFLTFEGILDKLHTSKTDLSGE